jgi:glucose-1-phosphate thymidylyltransferase
MKTLILAAGYATRLYPLTKDFPKPLLQVGTYTILDRLLTDLDDIDSVDEHIIVCNATFYPHFKQWKAKSNYKKPVCLINDGTTSNETRLGAVRDILLVIEKLSEPADLLVLAGDNIVNFSFSGFVDFAVGKRKSCITCHHEPSITALQKTGVLEVTPEMKVLILHEKPNNPPTFWAVPPFYIYRKEDLSLVSCALNEGCGFDAPGNLASWLCQRTDLYAWILPGERYDIGDLESYENVCGIFRNK